MENLVKQIKPRLEEHLDAFVIVGLKACTHERVSFGSVSLSRLIRDEMSGISESALLWAASNSQLQEHNDKNDKNVF